MHWGKFLYLFFSDFPSHFLYSALMVETQFKQELKKEKIIAKEFA